MINKAKRVTPTSGGEEKNPTIEGRQREAEADEPTDTNRPRQEGNVKWRHNNIKIETPPTMPTRTDTHIHLCRHTHTHTHTQKEREGRGEGVMQGRQTDRWKDKKVSTAGHGQSQT